MAEKPFKAKVAWGKNPEGFTEYGFDSDAELKAFMLGVDEACGWMEYDSITSDEKGYDDWVPEGGEEDAG